MEIVEPMLAETGQDVIDDPQYVYELKFNGMRIIGHKESGSVRLQGRSGLDYTARFPELHNLGDHIAVERAIVDGEVVCMGDDGLPDFNALQNRSGKTDPLAVKAMMKRYPAAYHIFDVVRVGDFDLTAGASAQANQMERRKVLEKILIPSDSIRLSPYTEESGIAVMEQVKAINEKAGRQVFDGVMAKTKSGLYHPGGRTSDWLKFKIPQYKNYIICGYTQGTGWREDTMGAIVLGKPENGHLSWVGCAGSGFTAQQLRELYTTLLGIRTDESPFPPDVKVPKLLSWVKPVLVVHVKFYDTTKTGQLIWPIFQSLNPYVTPEDLRKEAD